MEMHTLDKEGNRHFWYLENKAFRGAFVYILKADGFNMVKIGISSRPDFRFKRLWNKTPFSFSVLEIIQVGTMRSARRTERKLHNRLSHYRISKATFKELFDSDSFDGHTEWFELCAVTARVLHRLRREGMIRKNVSIELSNSVNYLDVTWPSSLVEEDPYQHWLAAET